jgi:hypothetical protein
MVLDFFSIPFIFISIIRLKFGRYPIPSKVPGMLVLGTILEQPMVWKLFTCFQ